MGLLALLAGTCVAIGFAVNIELHRFLIGQLDQRLRTAGDRYHTVMDHPDGDGDDPGRHHGADLSQAQGAGTLVARVTNGRLADVMVIGEERSASPVSTADMKQLVGLAAKSDQPHTYVLTTLGDYRIQAEPDMDGDVLITGLPLNDVNGTMDRLQRIEMMVFAVTLLAGGLAAAGLIRASLRPLRRVAATARSVAVLPLASGEVALPHRADNTDPRTEVGQVASAFNRMLTHIEDSLARRHASEDRLRSFVADASHELRTPLAIIRSYVELATRTSEPLPADVRQALNRLDAESIRMSRLVDDLLLLARLDAGRALAYEPVDLTRLAIDATNDARVAGPDHRWRLELPEEPVMVHGDEHRLHQVLANLLGNARVHTPSGTTVTVAVTESADRTAAEIRVIDDGPGIRADLLPNIFERFARADSSRSRNTGSTGLGLAIVAAVVTAHHGSVETTSQPGRTVFRVVLPCENPSTAAS